MAFERDSSPSVIAGVLSGTSADGIDVALCRPTFADRRLVALERLHGCTEPFPGDLAGRVRAVLDGGATDLAGVATLHRDLGRAFGAAARRVAQGVGATLDLVASHGQTVFHHDGDPALGPVTLQLGDGDQVAEAAGCAVASDFRTRDVAAGGEGAPLVGLVDDVLFAAAPRPLAILNLGGMANWTVLAGRGGPGMAFDVGPAAALMDGLARGVLGRPYDAGGEAALGGRADDGLLEPLLAHPFLAEAPPKSTGRDTFGAPWVQGILRDAARRGVRAPDLLATGAAFVGRTCAEALARCPAGGEGPLHVAVAGGGVHNAAIGGSLAAALAEVLGDRLAGPPAPSDRFGVPADDREAMAFAALGARLAVGEASASTLSGLRASVPGPRILGKWSPGP